MNRRSFIATLAGLPVVLKAISTGDFMAAAAKPEGHLEGWLVEFPDGSLWQFKGFITGMSKTSLSIQPVGPMTHSQREVPSLPKNAVPTSGTVVTRNGQPIGELTDITPPTLTRSVIETDDGDLIPGLKKMGDLTFTINFSNEEVLSTLSSPSRDMITL